MKKYLDMKYNEKYDGYMLPGHYVCLTYSRKIPRQIKYKRHIAFRGNYAVLLSTQLELLGKLKWSECRQMTIKGKPEIFELKLSPNEHGLKFAYIAPYYSYPAGWG